MGLFHYDKKGYPRWNDSNRTVHSTIVHTRQGEVVHHRDEDKGNFRRSNLQVMDRSDHSRYHAKKRNY